MMMIFLITDVFSHQEDGPGEIFRSDLLGLSVEDCETAER